MSSILVGAAIRLLNPHSIMLQPTPPYNTPRHEKKTYPVFCFLFPVIFLLSALHLVAEEPWKFGIMGDTHDSPPHLPGSEGVALDYIKVINQAFINHKVEFVVQCGDLADSMNGQAPKALEKRMEAADPLKQSGIPFYAVRGNHDSGPKRAQEFRNLMIPSSKRGDEQNGFVQNGENFALRHKNASFYFLDIDLSLNPSKLVNFSEWLKSYRSRPNPLPYCIVFTHRPLRTPLNFRENLFAQKNELAADEQNAFYKNLKDSGVNLVASAHLHAHIRAKVKSPDQKTTLDTFVCAPAGNKILPSPLCPPLGAHDKILNYRTSCVGYYIVTVYDDKLHIDFYAAPSTGKNEKDNSPPLDKFQVKDSWDIPRQMTL